MPRPFLPAFLPPLPLASRPSLPSSSSFCSRYHPRSRPTPCLSPFSLPKASLAPGDTIAIIGATGGVGRNLISYLQSSEFAIRAVARSPTRATDVLGPNIACAAADITDFSPEGRAALRAALDGAKGVVIATGTTAFPTKAWGKLWQNRPDVIDRKGTENIVECLGKDVERVVYVSSIGTLRSGSFPFNILNLFGVLDAKRKAEEAVQKAAELGGWGYAIVRAGRLTGGPRTNVGEIKKSNPKEGEAALNCVGGDSTNGEVSRRACARVVGFVLGWKGEGNFDFAAVNVEGQEVQREEFEQVLDGLAM